MTRKRFVKLLMAKGYSRNTAAAFAWTVERDHVSYAGTYENICRGVDVVSIPFQVPPVPTADFDRIAEAMQDIADSIAKMCRAMIAGAEAFGKAYRAEFEKSRANG